MDSDIVKIQSCIGTDGKPQLPCPPKGMCLGPDDRPLSCSNLEYKLNLDGVVCINKNVCSPLHCNDPTGLCPQLSISSNIILSNNLSNNVSLYNTTR